MSRIYWDTMLFVYLIEETEPYVERVRYIAQRMNDRNDTLCTNIYTLAELLAGFEKKNQSGLAAQTLALFDSGKIEVALFSTATAIRFGKIRAMPGISSSDAIHLASASEQAIDLFLT